MKLRERSKIIIVKGTKGLEKNGFLNKSDSKQFPTF